MIVWKFNENTTEFDRVLPAEIEADPDAAYVIREADGMLRLHAGGGVEIVRDETLTLAGVEFNQEQFDPELNVSNAETHSAMAATDEITRLHLARTEMAPSYRIMPPFMALTTHKHWSIVAQSQRIVGGLPSRDAAERVLALMYEMTKKGILEQVLDTIGADNSQAPFTAGEIELAYRLFQERTEG